MSELYFGRGTKEMFDDYMDFINYVFGFNGTERDFKKLLPKLYQYAYAPAVSSYVTTEDGQLRAAIGAFDHDISVCGAVLKTRGIGNVAVHPYHRSKGYMRKLMEMAVDDMVKDGVVLSVLGGRRQRYRYFSYDRLGPRYSFSLNSENIRHTYGTDFTPVFRLERVDISDLDVLENIRALSESKPLYAVRPIGDRYFETLISWRQNVFAVYDGQAFAGYAVEKGGEVSEFLLTPEAEEKLPLFFRDLQRGIGGNLNIKVPLYLTKYVKALEYLAEGFDIESSKSYSVLNYKAVTDAFLRLKLTYTHLPDGRLVLDIDGRGGREKIAIEVRDGVPSVTDTEEKADLTLGHIEAMNMLFGVVCAEREELPDFAKLWFPLPLFIYYSDTV